MVQPQRIFETSDLTRTIDALVTNEGATAHPYVLSRKLVEGRDATRNLADAVHFFGLLHGRHPGLMDHAAARATETSERRWFDQATSAFARERAYLSTLSAAAGPIPSTAGQQQCETTVLAQGHAIDMLGQSERRGCALGAAIAMALDWRAIRAVMDAAADRLDVPARPADLPDLRETIALIDMQGGSPAVERAMLFGAQQLLAQHRGLWDLLATREMVRNPA
ncbi:hypothetical protein GV829_10340 [Sphingomonas lacunae]|uniref:Uncharacterized protein n=1 Tax=Sphingomonas lacunae TaxID=2698828 RepID=A0A6M4AWT5_9SPHN|nr:hypothetical protein [Sphingomonas lacunae]QJQ32792.1 hypothetical protein GV829_10340 [Sphingomonas lacunae]